MPRLLGAFRVTASMARRRHVTRRALVFGTASGAIVLAGAAPSPGWLDVLAARVAAIGGVGLLRSYDVAGAAAFDLAHGNCAYVYDNAAAGIALLAGGHVAAARVLGDALVGAQARDRFWRDGRLRNAYAAGPVAATGAYPLPGWWDAVQGKWLEDAYQVGSGPGVMAWAMMFWMALFRATGEAAYRDAAGRAADWVVRSLRVPAGFSGGFSGWEPSPARLGWVSTEHNLDLSVAFAELGRTEAASHARAFVARMWHGREARFDAGLTPGGTVNPAMAADANLWPLLAPGAAAEWRASLATVLRLQGVPPAPPPGLAQGIDFDADRDGIWLEGTAYVALVARRAGQAALADRMLATLRGQTAASGLVWACTVPRLTTGFSTGVTQDADFFYYRRPHVGATAWAALAQMGVNPFEAGA